MKYQRTFGALLFIASIVLLLFALDLFGSVSEWLRIVAISIVLICVVLMVALRLRSRDQFRGSAKRARASILKHLWEERHKREW